MRTGAEAVLRGGGDWREHAGLLPDAGTEGERLVRVRVAQRVERGVGFTLVLANGRRIESGWAFGEAELERLIRVAEAS